MPSWNVHSGTEKSQSAASREAAEECSPQHALSLSKGRKPWESE
jgi:hypothetical protein